MKKDFDFVRLRKTMEVLKRHWLVIIITICATALAVYIVAMLIIIFAAPRTPMPTASVNTQNTSIVDQKIKGNKNSKIYHLNYCQNYNDIADRNIVWFKTEEEAIAAGYRRAKNC